MKRILFLSALLLSPVILLAQEENEAVAKLREALRTAVMQQRDLQGQIATLQATEIANKQEIEKLKAELKKLNEQAVEERNASANAIAELNNKVAERDATIAGNIAALDKWRIDYGHAIERARKAEADNAKKAAQILALERIADAQRTQNVQMYLVGMEILKRYDNFWFGDALLAREPFVGNTKVKLQNLAQEGHDKLLAARIRDAEGTSSQRTDNQTKPETGAKPAASPAPEPSAKPQPTPKQKPAPKATPKPKKKPGSPDGVNWPAPQPA
ncbi:MAG: hypothetical protein Fur0032_15590 [Terrimicrobiaceae bacterium]